jgi:hypothetical protein
MRRHTLKPTLVAIVIGFMLIAQTAATIIGAPPLQRERSKLFYLFRVDGTFSEELSAGTVSDHSKDFPGFQLTAARLEDDSRAFLSRLKSSLTIANNGDKRITEVAWRIDVYDASVRSFSASVLQTCKINIYPGETGVASEKFGAVLPDRMIVLLQLRRVSFADNTSWSSSEECSLAGDLKTVDCKSK